MSSVFWVTVPERAGSGYHEVFVGTRTTKAAALKLASKEMLSNKWYHGLSTVYEAKYDSYGRLTGLFWYQVARTGAVKMKGESDNLYMVTKPDTLIGRARKQYAVSNGQIVKRDVEPSVYSVLKFR